MTTHGEILVYRTDDGTVRLDVRLQDETVWLTQAMMAELFGTTQQNISSHLNNIYADKELLIEATHKKYLLVRQEGTRSVQREVDHYNLDAIISVGYRVRTRIGYSKSTMATKSGKRSFRRYSRIREVCRCRRQRSCEPPPVPSIWR